MATQPQQLWLPSSEEAGGYGVWDKGEAGWEGGDPADEGELESGTGAAIFLAIPVSQLISCPISVPDEEIEILPDLAATELEAIGITGPVAEKSVAHGGWIPISGGRAGESAHWAHGLADDVPCPDAPELHYLPSPLCYGFSDECVAVWTEGGRPVASWVQSGSVVHCTPLSSVDLNGDAAWQINATTQQLLDEGFLNRVPPVEIYGIPEDEGTGEFSDAIAAQTGLAPKFRPAPAPRLPELPERELVPQALADRLESRNRNRLIALGIGSFFCVLLLGLLSVAFLTWSEARGWQAKADELDRLAPELDRIRSARERWSSMEGSLEPEGYPVEVLFQCASLMPDRGVRLTAFELGNGKVSLSGVASSPTHALTFRDEFDRDGPLRTFDRTFPDPDILRDGQASFRADGVSIYSTNDG